MDRILGVAIGIATVCLIFSILASHIQEIWASFRAKRAVALETALRQMLSDGTLSSSFFNHPLIQNISFSRPGSAVLNPKAPPAPRPSYIAADLFNKVLQSILIARHNIQTKELPAIIAALPDSDVKRRMLTLTLGIENDAAACNAAIEKWYDDTMDRVNGFYKRHTQSVLLCLGIALAVVCNVNLLSVGRTLWTSAAARDSLATVAQNYRCKDGESCKLTDFTSKRDQVEKDLISLPLGYGEDFHLIGYWQNLTLSTTLLRQWAFNLIGWLLTAIAISLGAPFWFDLINKFINIRMVGQKPATAQDAKAANAAPSH